MSEQLLSEEFTNIDQDGAFEEIVQASLDPDFIAEEAPEDVVPFGRFTEGVQGVNDARRAATMSSTGYTGINNEESR